MKKSLNITAFLFLVILLVSLDLKAQDGVNPPIHDCDRLAASPFDRDAVAPAVSITKLDAAKAKAACEAALKEFPTVPRFQAQLGRALYAAKQMQEAFAWFQKAAQQGYEYGMATLGALYASGEGVPSNFPEAAKWSRKSGGQGSPLGQAQLAALYIQGHGLPKDQREATTWFQKALPWLQKTAEQGFSEAQGWLGWEYLSVSQDFPQAAEWYRKAAEQGDASAQMWLGWLYATGQGVPKDYTEAGTWFRKAADKGQIDACRWLGWLYETGSGVQTDLEQARTWYRKAADNGSADAQQSLRNVELIIANEQERLKVASRFPGIDLDHLDCRRGNFFSGCDLYINAPASFNVADEALLKDLFYIGYRSCNCPDNGTLRVCITIDQQLTQERCAIQGSFVAGTNGISRYSNNESNARASAAAEAAEREMFRVFAQSSGIQKMVSVDDLFANPFVYEGQPVGLAVGFRQMIARGKGLFTDQSQSKAVIISDLPIDQFVHEENQLLVVGRVKGTEMVGNTPLPLLAYVAFRKCATSDCSGEFRWHAQISK